jgi:hypothetical protein
MGNPTCSASWILRSRLAVVLPLRPLWSVPIQERRCRLGCQQAHRSDRAMTERLEWRSSRAGTGLADVQRRTMPDTPSPGSAWPPWPPCSCCRYCPTGCSRAPGTASTGHTGISAATAVAPWTDDHISPLVESETGPPLGASYGGSTHRPSWTAASRCRSAVKTGDGATAGTASRPRPTCNGVLRSVPDDTERM